MAEYFSGSDSKISKICEGIISSISSMRKRPRFFPIKLKQKMQNLALSNDKVSETINALFKGLEKDSSDKVPAVDLIQHLISLGLNIDPALLVNVTFIQLFTSAFKVPEIKKISISREEFHFLLFSDKKLDCLAERLQKCASLAKLSNFLPRLRLNPALEINVLTKFSNHSLIFPNKPPEPKAQDLFPIVSQWWDQIDIEQNGALPSKIIFDLLICKGIAENLSEAKKLLANSPKLTFRKDFLGIFTRPILRTQMIELSKNVTDLDKESFFIPTSQKLSSIKRKLLIQRISPDSKLRKKEGDGVINNLVRFQRHLRSVTPCLNR